RTSGREQHFLAVASGYRPGSEGRTRAALYLLALDKPGAEPWRRGRNYFRLPLTAPPAVDAGRRYASGLSAVAVVPATDGSARYAYGGDLQGRLWRFDLRSGPPWADAVPVLLFSATSADGAPQPIAQEVGVVHDEPGYRILFGTGRMLEPSDLVAPYTEQTLYGIRDTLQKSAAAQRDDLAEAGGPSQRGWRRDLQGGSAVGSPALAAGVVVFGSVQLDTCPAIHLTFFKLDPLTGLPLNLKGKPDFTLSYTGPVIAAPLAVAPSSKSVATSIVAITARGLVPLPAPPAAASGKPGRSGWREIVNWQQLSRKP
ncbi:MAG TPA: PilC/PilY family type IV pilus protein, partial [Burkholderiaceae bacterium]